MSNVALQVANITKVYKLYNQPTDRLKEALNPFKKIYHNNFYALNDVSFEVKKGETLGIIGQNGAGKSTLLKIITGVLTPTHGTVQANGRIASLLELGAGFNLEYTGMENIYLQGTLMGFSREDTELKIDEILSFASIGEFIHQPVKTYSSGMFARLAFAVAINVEPDILIVDEVLSVGDARFQSKCIRKMEEIAKKNITILFVSHDLQTIKKFCNNVIWLDSGKVVQSGKPNTILEDYISHMQYDMQTKRDNEAKGSLMQKQQNQEQIDLIDLGQCESFGEKKATFTKIGFFNDKKKPTLTFQQGDFITMICDFTTTINLYDIAIGLMLKDTHNHEILTFNSYMYNCPLKKVVANDTIRTSVRFKVPKLFPKEYIVTLALSEGTQMNHIQQHWIHEAASIKILSKDNIDGCMLTLYPNEIEYKYEQI